MTSQEGYYYGKTEKVLFKKQVHLISPEYDLKTDELDYDLKTEVADFSGPTTIVNKDGSVIQADKGRYDTKNDNIDLKGRTTLRQGKQRLTSEQFTYNKASGYGQAKGNVVWIDEEKNMVLNSQEAKFFDKDDRVEAYQDVLLTNLVDEDTLYLAADTLISFKSYRPQQKDSVQTFYAYRNVRLLKSDLQGVCDSLAYSLTDSVFRMYYNPVLWSDDIQMNADTIFVFTKNNEPEKIELRKNAFIGNKIQNYVFNQVQGKDINGYFKNGSIHRLDVDGNAESIYYAQNEAKEYIGVDKTTAASMRVYFDKSDVSRIAYYDVVQGTLYPIQDINPLNFILKGFQWMENRRPKSLRDLQ